MPRMRNNLRQRIDARTGLPYELCNDHQDIIYPIRPTHKQPQPQPQPQPQLHTRSVPQPTPSRHQPLALTYSQPTPGLEDHFLRSEFIKEQATPSPVTSLGLRHPLRTPEPITPQGPPRQDASPVAEHPRPPLSWLPDNSGYVLLPPIQPKCPI